MDSTSNAVIPPLALINRKSETVQFNSKPNETFPLQWWMSASWKFRDREVSHLSLKMNALVLFAVVFECLLSCLLLPSMVRVFGGSVRSQRCSFWNELAHTKARTLKISRNRRYRKYDTSHWRGSGLMCLLLGIVFSFLFINPKGGWRFECLEPNLVSLGILF